MLDFPLWVKQVLYIKLRDEMKSHLCKSYTDAAADNLLSVYVPLLTFKGKTELEKRRDGLDTNIYSFLELCAEGLSMLEVSLSTFLSMEEVSKYLIFCIEQSYIKKPLSADVNAMAGFIAGKYRIGEYFKQRGSITVDQLESAIIEQKSLREKGHEIKFADVMIALGMINEADVRSILVLKEEAKKRFILDYTMVPKGESTYADADEELKKENRLLKQENEILKRKMAQLVEIIKKNGN